MFTQRPTVFVNEVTDEVRSEDKRITWLRRHARTVALREGRAASRPGCNNARSKLSKERMRALTFDNRFMPELPNQHRVDRRSNAMLVSARSGVGWGAPLRLCRAGAGLHQTRRENASQDRAPRDPG